MVVCGAASVSRYWRGQLLYYSTHTNIRHVCRIAQIGYAYGILLCSTCRQVSFALLTVAMSSWNFENFHPGIVILPNFDSLSGLSFIQSRDSPKAIGPKQKLKTSTNDCRLPGTSRVSNLIWENRL